MLNDIQLSPHFKLLEFVASRTAEKHGIDNTPPQEAVANLRRLCEGCLEPLREQMGLPVVVTSGYRCRALNDLLVHHSRKSQHMVGQAADFWVQGSGFKVQGSASTGSATGLSRRELLIQAFRQIITDDSIDYDQLILYPSFIHVSYVSRDRNRRKLTKAYGNGKYCALTREAALSIL